MPRSVPALVRELRAGSPPEPQRVAGIVARGAIPGFARTAEVPFDGSTIELDDPPLRLVPRRRLCLLSRLRLPRQVGYKSVKFITPITVTDDIKRFGDGLGSSEPQYGYSWFAGE